MLCVCWVGRRKGKVEQSIAKESEEGRKEGRKKTLEVATFFYQASKTAETNGQKTEEGTAGYPGNECVPNLFSVILYSIRSVYVGEPLFLHFPCPSSLCPTLLSDFTFSLLSTSPAFHLFIPPSFTPLICLPCFLSIRPPFLPPLQRI